ncbi:MAG: YraN family protein [Acidimicrobiia bacterium]|nr:YraN family protein [Acidimicrobiia bacterium]MDH5293999.1 YraN family protein [Acidimicrobiia bacterium]
MDVGAVGEEVAAGFLRRRGARIVARNVVVPEGELDLLAVIDGVRVAVEVRSRRGEDPLEAFDDRKLDRVRRSAARVNPPCRRVDLITVAFGEEGVEIRWLPDM